MHHMDIKANYILKTDIFIISVLGYNVYICKIYDYKIPLCQILINFQNDMDNLSKCYKIYI